MSITATPGDSFEATVDNAPTGLVGTITVRIEDGQDTIVTAATTAGIVESGTGIYTATLTAPETVGYYVVIWNDGDALEAADDLLVATSLSASPGDPYFTVADLRARFPTVDEDSYSDELVEENIALAEQAFEHAAGVAFIPRTETITLASNDALRLDLPRAKVISVDSIDGSTTGSVTVDGHIVAGSVFVNASPWSTTETLTVELTHGYPEVPLRVKRAVMLLAKVWTVRGPVDDRATQIPAADGGVINLSTPGVFGATFGIPEVDACLKDYKRHALAL